MKKKNHNEKLKYKYNQRCTNLHDGKSDKKKKNQRQTKQIERHFMVMDKKIRYDYQDSSFSQIDL